MKKSFDKNKKSPLHKGNTLKAIFLLATLKSSKEFSHTETLCKLLISKLEVLGVQSEIVWLADHTIRPGIETVLSKPDAWPKILKRVIKSDIVIFATPIWWGIQSSLMQRIIERMDALNDELLETGKSEFSGKVGGIVITGAEDGTQHVTGNLLNFLIWNGFTIPPASSLSWQGDASADTEESLLKKLSKQKSTSAMARTMARNLVFFARLLKQHPIPHEKVGISGSIAEGTVGFGGDTK